MRISACVVATALEAFHRYDVAPAVVSATISVQFAPLFVEKLNVVLEAVAVNVRSGSPGDVEGLINSVPTVGRSDYRSSRRNVVGERPVRLIADVLSGIEGPGLVGAPSGSQGNSVVRVCSLEPTVNKGVKAANGVYRNSSSRIRKSSTSPHSVISEGGVDAIRFSPANRIPIDVTSGASSRVGVVCSSKGSCSDNCPGRKTRQRTAHHHFVVGGRTLVTQGANGQGGCSSALGIGALYNGIGVAILKDSVDIKIIVDCKGSHYASPFIVRMIRIRSPMTGRPAGVLANSNTPSSTSRW